MTQEVLVQVLTTFDFLTKLCIPGGGIAVGTILLIGKFA